MATILSEPSGSGRCNAFASSKGARIQTSYSSVVVRITGMALGCTRFTSAFGSQVRKPKTSAVTSPSFALRTEVQFVQMPPNPSSGRLSSGANHTGSFLPSMVSYSLKLVNGTRQRLSGPSHRFQCLLLVLRMLVVPLSGSILITLEVDQADVVIDGRDFLATIFQLGNPAASRGVLERLFGPAILRYADRAWSVPALETRRRIACCDLARQDDAVIAAHAAKELVIGGRYRTRFSSAFMVRAPVAAERIVSVERVDHRDYVLPDIDITLEQALGR